MSEWPFYLEVVAPHGVGAAAFLKALARLLNGLESGGLRVVAACAFENDLAAQRREAAR